MGKLERKILLNPGPATTSNTVKYAQIVPDICPREKEFTQIMKEIRRDLVKIARGDENYTCILFAGSGTAVMDSVLSSVIPDDKKLLIINNGLYGDRFAEIAQIYNINHINLKFDLTKPINLEKVTCELEKDSKIKYIAIVHHETTTGILNPLKEVGKIAKKNNCVYIADTISSFAGVPFSIKDCNVDFIMSTSNKCMQAMPGASFVICKKSELEKIKKYPKKSFYLNLYDQYENFEKTGQTRFTPPVQTIYSLKQSINELFEEGGVENRYKRYTKNWRCLIDGLEKFGFKPMLNEKIHSRISTTFLEPKNMNLNFIALHDKLYEKGFTIYPDRVGDKKSIRFANMGDINKEDIELFLKTLKEIYKK